MNQVNKEHQEWVNARQEEEQVKRAVHLARLKTAGLVVAALVISWFLYRHFLGTLVFGPAVALVLLAWRWKRAFPTPDTGDAAVAGELYPWTFSKSFRRDARYAFKCVNSSLAQYFHVQGRLGLIDLMAKNLEAFLQDLPDLKRLGEDRDYAEDAFRRVARKRMVLFLSLDVVYHLALIVVYPPYAAWCVVAALLTGVISVPLARGGALGNPTHFMASYGWLHVYLRDAKKRELQEMLTASGLTTAIRENA